MATSIKVYGFAAEKMRFLSHKILCSRSRIGKIL